MSGWTSSEFWVLVLKGLVAGLIWGGWGYYQLARKNGEPFSGPKFLRAVASGAVAGAIAAVLGLDIIAADQLMHGELARLGLLFVMSLALDHASVWLWRQVPKQLKSLLEWIHGLRGP
jgi:hypothetical protein